MWELNHKKLSREPQDGVHGLCMLHSKDEQERHSYPHPQQVPAGLRAQIPFLPHLQLSDRETGGNNWLKGKEKKSGRRKEVKHRKGCRTLLSNEGGLVMQAATWTALEGTTTSEKKPISKGHILFDSFYRTFVK